MTAFTRIARAVLAAMILMLRADSLWGKLQTVPAVQNSGRKKWRSKMRFCVRKDNKEAVN